MVFKGFNLKSYDGGVMLKKGLFAGCAIMLVVVSTFPAMAALQFTDVRGLDKNGKIPYSPYSWSLAGLYGYKCWGYYRQMPFVNSKGKPTGTYQVTYGITIYPLYKARYTGQPEPEFWSISFRGSSKYPSSRLNADAEAAIYRQLTAFFNRYRSADAARLPSPSKCSLTPYTFDPGTADGIQCGGGCPIR